MQYWIYLKDRHGEPYCHHDNILPGLIPAHVIDMMQVPYCEELLGLDCEHCDMACHCHVLEGVPRGEVSRKFCTILFHDAVKPQWNLAEVL